MPTSRWFISSLTLIGIVTVLLLVLSPHKCFAETPLSDAGYRALQEKTGKSSEDLEVLNRERKYRVFRPVIGIWPQILLYGSAKKLGLDSMDDYLALRFANDLKDYTKKDSPNLDEAVFFACEIWTVGEKYPIALHLARGPRVISAL